MYYRLKDNFLLRGWKKLPYAILDKNTRLATFLNGEQFVAVKFCTGTMREDCGLIFPQQKAIIEVLVKQGIAGVVSMTIPTRSRNTLSFLPAMSEAHTGLLPENATTSASTALCPRRTQNTENFLTKTASA